MINKIIIIILGVMLGVIESELDAFFSLTVGEFAALTLVAG